MAKQNIYKVKQGSKIKFGEHKHWIIDKWIDCTGMTGTVIESAHLHVIVDLHDNTHQITLADWENCLVFCGEQKYNNVNVNVLPSGEFRSK